MQLSQSFASLPGWAFFCALLAICTTVFCKVARIRSAGTQATPLTGPPNPSWLWGVPRSLQNPGSGSIYDKWVCQYGSVFRVPGPLGSSRVVLTDPKAVAHFYSLNGWTYVWPRVPSVMVKGAVSSSVRSLIPRHESYVCIQFGHHALVVTGGEPHKRYVCTFDPHFFR